MSSLIERARKLADDHERYEQGAGASGILRELASALEQARDVALEEAAKECERLEVANRSETTVGESMSYTDCAHAIRALNGKKL